MESPWPGPEFEPDEARAQANAVIADPGSPAITLLDLIRQRAEKHREIHLARWALGVIDEDSEQSARQFLRFLGRPEILGQVEKLVTAEAAQRV